MSAYSLAHRETGTEEANNAERVPIELSDLPQSVQDLVRELSAETKQRLIENKETVQKSLVDVLSGFDQDTLESYARLMLVDYFYEKTHFISLVLEPLMEERGVELAVTELLDTMWNNRGVSPDNMILMGARVYDRYQKERDALIQRKDSLETTIDQIKSRHRRTSAPDEELFNARQQQQATLIKLNDLENRYMNSVTHIGNGVGIEARMKNETKWMQGLATAAQFLHPMEFATLAGEQLDFVFNTELQIAKEGKVFGRTVPDERRQQASAFVEALHKGVDKWAEHHSKEQPIRKLGANEQSHKQQLIDYLKLLCESYRYRKEECGHSDVDQLVCIRQMEVALRLLARKE